MTTTAAIHKATPAAEFAQDMTSVCIHCHRDINRVPGGQGPTWVHADTGAVAGPGPTNAVGQAEREYGALCKAARFAKAGLMTTPDEQCRAVLVDGSMFSPSTRAVGNSEHVWQTGSDSYWTEYDEALVDKIAAYYEDGWSMGWNEGVLWLYGPGYDPDGEVAA